MRVLQHMVAATLGADAHLVPEALDPGQHALALDTAGPDGLFDRSERESSGGPVTGMPTVLVNGQVAIANGAYRRGRFGKALHSLYH